MARWQRCAGSGRSAQKRALPQGALTASHSARARTLLSLARVHWCSPLPTRYMRIFAGGDWLSVAVPNGTGPPSSKCFCIWCLGLLNENNLAGVPHGVRPQPAGDPRPLHVAHPPLRGGSLAVGRRALAYHEACRRWKRDGGKKGDKPEPAAYQSCLEQPMLWCKQQTLTQPRPSPSPNPRPKTPHPNQVPRTDTHVRDDAAALHARHRVGAHQQGRV